VELDLEIKLRVERMLWASGFYTRTDVRLASAVKGKSSNSGSTMDLTDVDVLGIRFLEDLSPRKTVVDCKSGKNVSPIGRAFWLRGVMDHFKADRGYVVLARTIPEHQREAAANLNVTLLNVSDLTTIEARYGELSDDLRIGKLDAHNYLEGNIRSLPAGLASLVGFRDTTYWYSTTPRAMSQSISLVKRSIGGLDLKQRFHKAILMDVIGLFALSSVTLASDLMRLAPLNLLDSIRALFFGGPEGIVRREQIIRQFQEILSKISKQRELPLDQQDLFQLDPPYLAAIADAVVRVIARPIEAAEAPRYLKTKLMHGILYDEWDLPEIIGDSYSPLADKIATDIGLAFLKSCGLGSDVAIQLGFK